MEAILISVALIICFFVLFLYGKIAQEEGYKKGQIDYKNGIDKFTLIEFEDGTREYYKKSELKDLKVHKEIIKSRCCGRCDGVHDICVTD